MVDENGILGNKNFLQKKSINLGKLYIIQVIINKSPTGFMWFK
jgi:hypothetical protein